MINPAKVVIGVAAIAMIALAGSTVALLVVSAASFS